MNPHQLGINLACIANDVAPAEFETIKGATTAMREVPGAEAFGRQIARLAHEIFVKSGSSNSLEANLYLQLSKTAGWTDFHYDMLDPVYVALGKFDKNYTAIRQEKNAAAQTEKAASMLRNTLGKILSIAPQWLYGSAVAGGTGLGALHWMLNRDAQENDADATAIESKIDHYNGIRKEIEDELRRNPPPELRKALKQKLETTENPGYAL